MSHNIKTMYDSLRTEYTKAEDELKTVDNSLKKLIGTDTYNETSSISRTKEIDRRRTGRAYLDDSKRYSRSGEMGRKRKLSESNSRIFSRLDKRLDDDLSRSVKRPSLQSTIVSTVSGTNQSAPVKVKQENVVQQEKEPDKKSAVRNRRMFGMIMGTLQKFQSEETQRKVVTIKREEIEKKLDKADADEKEAVKKERQSLILSRKDKQTHLRDIEVRMERVEIHQQWEKSNQHLANFIQTKTKPHIFYMPNKLTPETEKRLKETKDKYLIILAERRAKTQKEMEDLNKKDDELRKENLSSVIKCERREPENLKNGLKSEVRSTADRNETKNGRSDAANDKQETDKEASRSKRDKFEDKEYDDEQMSDKSDSKHSGEHSDDHLGDHSGENWNGGSEEAKPDAEEHCQKELADDSIDLAVSHRSTGEFAGDESNQTNEISQQTNDGSTANEVSRSAANTEENTQENTQDNMEDNPVDNSDDHLDENMKDNPVGNPADNSMDNNEDNTEDNMDDNSNSQPQQQTLADKEDKEFEPIYDE